MGKLLELFGKRLTPLGRINHHAPTGQCRFIHFRPADRDSPARHACSPARQEPMAPRMAPRPHTGEVEAQDPRTHERDQPPDRPWIPDPRRIPFHGFRKGEALKKIGKMLGQDRCRGQPFLPFDCAEVHAFRRFPGLQFADVHALRFRKPFGGFGRLALGIERDGFGRPQRFLQRWRLPVGQPLDENRKTTRSPKHPNLLMRKTVIRQQSGHQFSELRHGRLNHLPRQLLGPDFQEKGGRGERLSCGVFRGH